MIWLAMCGSGAVTGMENTVHPLRPIPKVQRLAHAVCIEVVVGATSPVAATCPTGASAHLATETMTLVYVLPFSFFLNNTRENNNMHHEITYDL